MEECYNLFVPKDPCAHVEYMLALNVGTTWINRPKYISAEGLLVTHALIPENCKEIPYVLGTAPSL